MALIRLTIIESFRKHNVVLGESAPNWRTEYRCGYVKAAMSIMICFANTVKSPEDTIHITFQHGNTSHATEEFGMKFILSTEL